MRDGLLMKYKEMYKISLSINIKEQSFNFLCKNILKAYTETKQIFSQLWAIQKFQLDILYQDFHILTPYIHLGNLYMYIL